MQFRGLLYSLVTLALCLSSALVAATGCSGCGGGKSCGSITNKAGVTLRYTTNPSPTFNSNIKDSMYGKCRFWNWYASNSAISIVPHDQTVYCTQKSLASGSGKKGGCSQKIDVDGFTFPNNKYWIQVPFSSIPKPVEKGVWTKFPDIVDITCRRVPVVGSILCTFV